MKKEQIEQLRHLSRKLVRELGLLQPDQSDVNTTPAHWHALVEIDKEPGITLSKLANLLLISLPKVSGLIKSLKKDGLIELKIGGDRREKHLHITAAGKTIIEKIDKFSQNKIKGALEFLDEAEMLKITESIDRYSSALEKSRLLRERVKILTLSTSRTIRKQIVNMVENIQKNEFSIPITEAINSCVLKAEQDFYYNNSYNFWYAVDDNGKIIGSVGLKQIDATKGEIKKFFVIKEYRSKGVAQKLMNALFRASKKHGFKTLYLGTVDTLKAAHKFYDKYGFKRIQDSALPNTFKVCHLDSIFFECDVNDSIKKFI